MVDLDARYPGEPSVAVSLLLNLVELSPGEAIRLDAGNLHAYLSGSGLELMGSSDNVVRGGLTSKPVDVDLLLSTVDLDTTRATRCCRSPTATSCPRPAWPCRGSTSNVRGDRAAPTIVFDLAGRFTLVESGMSPSSRPAARRRALRPNGPISVSYIA